MLGIVFLVTALTGHVVPAAAEGVAPDPSSTIVDESGSPAGTAGIPLTVTVPSGGQTPSPTPTESPSPVPGAIAPDGVLATTGASPWGLIAVALAALGAGAALCRSTVRRRRLR